jgi:hypothetical protein
MLTVADRNQAEIPEELSGDRSWFQWFVSASRLLGGPAKSKPAIAYMLATDRWYTHPKTLRR